MAKRIKTLQKKRDIIKDEVARFESHLESLNSDSHIDIISLQHRRDAFRLTLSKFNDIQEEIELREDAEHPLTSTEQRLQFESLYYSLCSKVDKIISRCSNSRTIKSESSNATQAQLRLPEINLPKFSGNYEEWYNFYNTFDSVVNSNDSLAKIQKLHYLKSLLRGEASEILSSIEISNENYDCAWDLLKARYDNKRIIINKHIQSILNLPVMTKENSVALRKIVDGVTKHIRILKSLGRPVETWDDIIIHTITMKFDSNTIKEWETSLDKNVLPTLTDLTSFLSKKCTILEAVSEKPQVKPPVSNSGNKNFSINLKYQKPVVAAHVSTNKFTCMFCKGEHAIYRCSKFINLTPEQRINEIESRNLCKNCLRKSHQSDTCNSGSCRICQKRHNSLLHITHSSVTSAPEEKKSLVTHHVASVAKPTQVLLSTVIVGIRDATGHYQDCRALLDSGSQSCFITESFAKRLKLPLASVNIPVTGISNMRSDILSKINITFKSRYNSFKKNIDCLILKRITGHLPSNGVDISHVKIPANIQLANPHFHKSGPIDLLIGAEIFWELLFASQIKLGKSQPTFQKTQLGWIISGKLPVNLPTNPTTCNLAIDSQLNEKLTKFWNLEEYSEKQPYSVEEQMCENHFLRTFKRDDEGRFIVQLPFKKNSIQSLGNSRSSA